MNKIKYLKNDFLPSSVSKTRRAQFFDLISSNYGTYFKLGLNLLLFSLPLLSFIIFEPFIIRYLESSLTSQGLDNETINNSVKFAGYLIMFLKDLSLLILAIPLSGLGRINREMSFSKGIIFSKDFGVGIKQNWKTFILVTLIMSFLLFAIEVNTNVLIELTSTKATYILSGIMYGIFFIILLPTNSMILVNSTIYSLKYTYSFLNCIKFVIKNLFVSLLFMLLPAGLYFLQLFDKNFIVASIYAVVILLILPLYCQAWHQYCLSKFDLYINKKNYPEIYLKGLYQTTLAKGEIANEK